MALSPILYRPWHKPVIGRGFTVGHNVLIDGHAQVTIGNDVSVGHNVMILTGQHDYARRGLARQRAVTARPVRIANGVWICSGAIICPGVVIGEDSVVGPGAVVMRNVPARTIVGGNPAQRVRRLGKEA